jgi:hypothetical protein
MNRKERLLQQIKEAFDGVDRVGAISMHEATALDDYASAAERVKARELDTDTCWQEVPDEHIARHYSIFSFLDVKGHVYYAPAYMSWLVRVGYDTDSNSTESAQFAFNPWGKHQGGTHHKPHDMFTEPQCKAIAAYLLYVYEVLDEGSCCSTAKPYLERYWASYL